MPKSPVVDAALVEHVAKLAALRLEKGEVETLTRELAAIVGYVEELAQVDTAGVEPTSHVQAGASGEAGLRPDIVQPGLSQEEALAAAPRKGQNGFAVPGFVEG